MSHDDDIEPVAFGNYWLLERLAVGGMAEVFLACSDQFEQLVALKRILPNIAANDEFIAMFLDEAKIAGQLTHPGIAQILDVGRIHDSYYLAMEYVSGQDVRALWDRSREADLKTPIPIACAIGQRLAQGLDHAHRKRDAKGRAMNIIHRDVSPQNVLLGYDGTVKVIDFGVAKAANRLVRTQTGIMKGKFAYMSPEQARAEPIDHRADVFAIGVVLYELLSGERAFKADSDFALLEKVRRVDITPLRHLRPDVPRELDRLVMKALARTEQERYGWASALATDLQQYLADSGMQVTEEAMAAHVRSCFRTEHLEEQRRLKRYLDKAATLPALGAPPSSSTNADRLDYTQLEASALASPRPPPLEPSLLPVSVAAVAPSSMRIAPLAAAIGGMVIGVVVGMALLGDTGGVDTMIVSTPTGAEVSMGGVAVCTSTPCTARLGPGQHALTLQRQGINMAVDVVITDAARDRPIVVEATFPQPTQAVVIETTPPGAWLWVDGQLMSGTTPLQLPAQPLGTSLRVTVAHDGNEPFTLQRTIDSERTWHIDLPSAATTLTLQLEPADARLMVAGRERSSKQPLPVSRRPTLVELSRPGCESQQFQLMGNGQPQAQASLVLRCHPLVGQLRVVSVKKPTMVRIGSTELGRTVTLDALPMPAGDHVVMLRSPKGKLETHNAVITAGTITTIEASF